MQDSNFTTSTWSKERRRIENRRISRRTVIVKERRGAQSSLSDGSRRNHPDGFFNGEFNGIDMTVKDGKRFPDNGWVLPSATSVAVPRRRQVADQPVRRMPRRQRREDDIWIQFYPLLRDRRLLIQRLKRNMAEVKTRREWG